MILNLKEKFVNLTTRYKAELDAYKNEVAGINRDMETVRQAALSTDPTAALSGPVPDHSTAYYYKQLQALDAAMSETDANYNSELHTLLQEAVESLKGMASTKEDHQPRLQNALTYIALMGAKMTDETAWGLLSPLFGDYSTMENLYLVLNGRDNLSITNSALSCYVSVVAGLKLNMEESEFLFNHATFSRNPLALIVSFDMLTAAMETADEDTAFADSLIKTTFVDAKRAVGQRLFHLKEAYRHANR